eukprot:SM000092S24510  [mRNA]  locus=s92:301941:311125:- [translate_table: standard]
MAMRGGSRRVLLRLGGEAALDAVRTPPEPGARPIDAPGGFLFEWWSVFWDIFIARTNEKHSEVAASYIDGAMSAMTASYAAKIYEERLKSGQASARVSSEGVAGLEEAAMKRYAVAVADCAPTCSLICTICFSVFLPFWVLWLGCRQLLANSNSSMAVALRQAQLQNPQLLSQDNKGDVVLGVQRPTTSQESSLFNMVAQNSPRVGSGLSPTASAQQLQQLKQGAPWSHVASGKGGRKRKGGPATSSGPAHSTGTQNTTGPAATSPPTPSAHNNANNTSNPGGMSGVGPTTAGGGSSGGPVAVDVVNLPGIAAALHHSNSVNNKHSNILFGSNGGGAGGDTLSSPVNQLGDLERFADDGSLDDNVESFLSAEEADTREALFGSTKRNSTGHSAEVKGFTFNEVCKLRASTNKVVCCHFSSDGKVLATAGHDKTAVLWNMDTFQKRSTLEEHSLLITDVRFSPSSTRLATSSFDKIVRVWDSDNPTFSMRVFSGHQTSVMSLDFHPNNEDLLCSCDGDSEIRYWSVNGGHCTRVFKGAMSQMRFQPRAGRLLAAAADNVVSIFDVESETLVHALQRHTKPVHSVCWDAAGDFVASVSEDSVRVWALGRGQEGECIHELISSGNKFHSCIFHPKHPSLLVIGCYQSLELWNMVENKSMTMAAHDGLIAALAVSPSTGMIASASHDKSVKLWK